jgi:catechol 2,3-dioxygenase-like lactoylglutathione lyase family enzyme
MVKKISHVGILVDDIEKAIPAYATITGCAEPVRCTAPELGLKLAYFPCGNGDLVEIVETSAKTEMKHGDVVVALEVDDIAAEVARLKGAGMKAYHLKPTENMPFERGWVTKGDAHGTIIEFCPPNAVKDLVARARS